MKNVVRASQKCARALSRLVSQLGEVVVLANSEGARTTPSYVAFTDEGRIVGQAAKAQVASNAKGTVFDVKRILGRTFEDHTLQEEAKRMPFGVVDGGAKSCVKNSTRVNREKQTTRAREYVFLVTLKKKASSMNPFPWQPSVPERRSYGCESEGNSVGRT